MVINMLQNEKMLCDCLLNNLDPDNDTIIDFDYKNRLFLIHEMRGCSSVYLIVKLVHESYSFKYGFDPEEASHYEPFTVCELYRSDDDSFTKIHNAFNALKLV